jgi:hypothetical protein
VLVYQFGHPGMKRNIVLAPQPDLGTHIGGVMDVALLGAHHRPTTFSIDRPNMCANGRIVPPGARTVGHLVETVTRSHRADLYRLEKHSVWVGVV